MQGESFLVRHSLLVVASLGGFAEPHRRLLRLLPGHARLFRHGGNLEVIGVGVGPGEHPDAGLDLAVDGNVRVAQVGRLGEAPASEPLGDAVEGVGAVEHDHVAGHLQRGVPGLDGVLPVQVGFDVAGLGDPAVPTDLVDAEDIAPGRGIREGAVRLGPALAEIESKKSAGVSLKLISLVQLALGGSEPGRVAPQKAHADVRSVHVGGPRVLVAGRQREDPGRVRLAGVHRRGQHGHH